ncbi:MAG: hypothetical protein L0332_23865 [Chloroflexi bacterium]|nr:hypothetical protein [Chloroflexota bacterium]
MFGKEYAAPLLAVDRVLEISDHSIQTAKAISGNEPFFPGHFPGHPIFPGNFILEAAHQATRTYVARRFPPAMWARLVEVRSIRFLAPLQPGDRLQLACRYTFSPERGELGVNADCFRGEGMAIAKIKMFYHLGEEGLSLGQTSNGASDQPGPSETRGRIPPLLDHTGIQKLIPHRYPMLLVDAVRDLEPGVSIVAMKCVTGNEPCYAGLLDGVDVYRLAYPYSLILESCGQAGGILWMCSRRSLTGRDVTGLPIFVSARDCFFEGDVLPGDTMEHRVRLERVIADTVFLAGETWVNQHRIAQMGWLMAVAQPTHVLDKIFRGREKGP